METAGGGISTGTVLNFGGILATLALAYGSWRPFWPKKNNTPLGQIKNPQSLHARDWKAEVGCSAF
jgi:hypothetical protein